MHFLTPTHPPPHLNKKSGKEERKRERWGRMASSVLFLIPLKLERGIKFKIDRKVGEVMSGIGKGECHMGGLGGKELEG